MNIDYLLSAAKSKSVRPTLSWARVWMRPDVFSEQSFIIGAVALCEGAVVDFRLISSVKKLACFYGKSAAQLVIEPAIESLRAQLFVLKDQRASAEIIPSVSDHFSLEYVGVLNVSHAADALDRMLQDGSIPAESGTKIRSKSFRPRSSGQVVKDVIDRLKVKASIFSTQFLREDYYGDEEHQAKVNLVTAAGAGLIASGWYTDPTRVQLEYLLAAAAVETYAKLKSKEQAALFFVRPVPECGLSEGAFLQIEEALTDLTWKMNQKQLRVFVHHDSEAVAQDVLEWVAPMLPQT